IDRIDNDGDSPEMDNFITAEMIEGEIADNLIDDNGNGLIDENQTHIPFGVQRGVHTQMEWRSLLILHGLL
ncbi:MAG: hypothetical protein Q8T08_14965, partial [Ignavibacteria bacterium]|nr:hypothetical protein [Ignavibacteria bacterium]